MPKDFDKYLTTSLKVYIFVLACIFIMKIVGLDYFGLDINNAGIKEITELINSSRIINNLYHIIPLLIYQYITIALIVDDNSRKLKIWCIALAPLTYLLQAYKITLFGGLSFLVEICYYFIIILTFCKTNLIKFKFKRFIAVMGITLIIQIISILTRINYSIEYIENPVANFIINLDYFIMMIICYKLNFMKGGITQWTDGSQDQAGSSSQKRKHLKKSLKKLQENLHNFKAKPKQERIAIVIYILLSTIWNSLTVVIILIVAKLNGTLIECIFIASSFWLSKHSFGKPFHLASMTKCFIISNISYYILNRLTTPLGISVFVPVLLGVGLSYATSKLVKKTYKALYKGMPKELFEETILKVADKNSQKYKICYDFYINGKSDLSLSFQYNYSIAGIRKIKSRINDEIRRLK